MEKRLSLRKDKDFQKVYKKNFACYNRDFTVLVKNYRRCKDEKNLSTK